MKICFEKYFHVSKTISGIYTRCPSDLTVKYHSAPTVSAHRFSLEAFKFIADHPFVFVHCHVIVCNATDPTSKCGKKCSPSGRGRREVSSHMTDDVYMLAQGPIHLGHQKRDANEGGVGQSGERLGTSFKRRMGWTN